MSHEYLRSRVVLIEVGRQACSQHDENGIVSHAWFRSRDVYFTDQRQQCYTVSYAYKCINPT